MAPARPGRGAEQAHTGPFRRFENQDKINDDAQRHQEITKYRNGRNLTAADLPFLRYGMGVLGQLTGLTAVEIAVDALPAFLGNNSRVHSAEHYKFRNTLKRHILPTLVTNFRLIDSSITAPQTTCPIDTQGKECFKAVLRAADDLEITDAEASVPRGASFRTKIP
ncbi:hypothetical protein JCM3770_004260 [Rhodotorula araucariae]